MMLTVFKMTLQIHPWLIALRVVNGTSLITKAGEIFMVSLLLILQTNLIFSTHASAEWEQTSLQGLNQISKLHSNTALEILQAMDNEDEKALVSIYF
jgi:hypothetical protein